MKFIFFSLRNFDTDVGESVRIYGILNTLASYGHEVTFISNAHKHNMFHPSINHINIGYDFKGKRNLQGMLSILPAALVYKKYKRLFNHIENALKKAKINEERIFFFDYLDNTIGYLLKKMKKIKQYINDIHGIVTIEFLNNIKNSKGLKDRIVAETKYLMAGRLDKKVFEFADGFIFASAKMKDYYEKRYVLKNKICYVIPYVLELGAIKRTINEELKKDVKNNLGIASTDFIILFVGSYKATAGVEDLIMVFDRVYKVYKNAKLILIGAGPNKDYCVKLANNLASANNISFIQSISYSDLPTYQSLSNVIICPDRNNPFSQFVIHIKYLDALMSGKLVINGAFESVKEINADERLSLMYEPSNLDELYGKIIMCIENYDDLQEKYKHTKEYTMENLTYDSYLKNGIQ